MNEKDMGRLIGEVRMAAFIDGDMRPEKATTGELVMVIASVLAHAAVDPRTLENERLTSAADRAMLELNARVPARAP